MAVDCRDAIEMSVAAIMGSTARPYHANLPTTSLMCLIIDADIPSDVSFFSTWILTPYWIGAAFAGACCGLVGFGCWCFWRDFGTKVGMCVSAWASHIHILV